MKARYKNLMVEVAICCLFIFISYFFIYPFLSKGVVYNGDDAWFQIDRINEIKQNIRAGNILPYIYSSSFGNVAYPLGIFYPEITLIPVAIISLLFPNQVTGIYVGVMLYTFLTLYIMYFIGKKINFSRISAILMAVIYSFSAYRTIDAFTRFSIGEYIALTFVPLCFYGLYGIIYKQKKDWIYLAIGMTMILLSHVLTGFIMGICLAFCWLISLFYSTQRLQNFKYIVLSTIMTLLASAIFFVPFLEQVLYQKYNKPTPINIFESGVNLSSLLLASINNSFLRNISEAYNIGVVMIIIILIGILRIKDLSRKYRTFFLSGTIIFICSSNIFPWFFFQETPFSVIQYTFRLLMIPTFIFSVISGKLVNEYVSLKSIVTKVVTLIGCMLVVFLTWSASVEKLENSSNYIEGLIYTNKVTFFNNTQHFDEYVPAKSVPHLGEVMSHVATLNHSEKETLEVTSEPGVQSFSSDKFEKGMVVDIPVAFYKNFVAYQGTRELQVSKSNKNTIRVKLVNSEKVNIKYNYTALDFISYVLSLLTWIVMVLLLGNRVIQLLVKKSIRYS